MKSTYPKIVMYSRNLCSDCIRSKNFLEKNEIPFEEINIIEAEPEIVDISDDIENNQQDSIIWQMMNSILKEILNNVVKEDMEDKPFQR